jgi:aspartate aminotransferase/aminotransferase
VTTRNAIVSYAKMRGISALPGTATFYAFPSIAPSKLDSETFSSRLLEEYKVSVVPGIGYGKSCDAFVRISVGTESMEKLQGGIESMKRLIEETS